MAVGDLVRQDWPRGRAVVLGAPGFPEGRGSAGGRSAITVDLTLSVLVRGHAPYEVDHRCRAPAGKLPPRGAILPVLVHPQNERELRVDWTRAPTEFEHAELVLRQRRPVTRS
jgi:hypothetical protein